MPTIENHGFRIHYEVHGSGQPVLLIHGGTVSFKHNYADFGWIEAMNRSGLQVIGLDLRGHGQSDKPHKMEAYGTSNLASDVVAVLDQLSLTHVSLVAYSIGTAVALHLLKSLPERFDRAALIATGDGLIGHPPHTFALALPSLLDGAGPSRVSERPSETLVNLLELRCRNGWRLAGHAGTGAGELCTLGTRRCLGDQDADAGHQRSERSGSGARPKAGAGPWTGAVRRGSRRRPLLARRRSAGESCRCPLHAARYCSAVTPRQFIRTEAAR